MNNASVRKELVVKASRDRAFAVFTDGIDQWWPREHHIGKSPLKRTLIEPRINGRWYSICEDDTQIDVGRVRTWDPPNRLVVTWQINGQWQYDPTFETEIEVVFEALGPKQTRVLFEHRGLERYGPATDQVRMMFESPDGWGGTLAFFVEKAAEEDQSIPTRHHSDLGSRTSG